MAKNDARPRKINKAIIFLYFWKSTKANLTDYYADLALFY